MVETHPTNHRTNPDRRYRTGDNNAVRGWWFAAIVLAIVVAAGVALFNMGSGTAPDTPIPGAPTSTVPDQGGAPVAPAEEILPQDTAPPAANPEPATPAEPVTPAAPAQGQ